MNTLHILLLLLSFQHSTYITNFQGIETGATPPTTLAVSNFDCGPHDQFATHNWYLPLILVLQKHTTFYTEEYAQRIWEMNKDQYQTPQDVIDQIGSTQPDNITQMCYAANTNLVILSASDYMIRGVIFVYDISPKILSELPVTASASFRGESYMGFGEQQGTLLPVRTAFGDGLGMTETIYNLDLTTQTLIPIKNRSCVYNDEINKQECEEINL